MRDFQRGKVYAWERSQPFWWENDWGNGNASERALTLKESEAFIKKACFHYKVGMPNVKHSGNARTAYGSSWQIKLPNWSRTKPVILHEIAHTIAAQKFINDKHGPVWLRIFIQLLSTYLDQNEQKLVKSAKKYGLKVAGHQPVRSN